MTRSHPRRVSDRRGATPAMRYPRRMTTLRVALVAAMWVVSGCSAASSSADDHGSLTPASEQPSVVPSESASGSAGTSSLPASITDPIIAEIAGLAGVPVDQVVVVSAEAVTFPDGGLGCPQPGMAYTQVLVDGYKVVATAAGKTYDYRGTGAGTFRRCENASG
jgi:hypothetical protein